jgi:hypothetical protein
MAFQLLFENPVFGDHCPLVLGWSDDQLKPVVNRLASLLPDNLTDQMQLAIASIARSIVAEEKITGLGVHYARKRDRYGHPQRYRDGDPRFSWYYVTRAMDNLLGAGLIGHALGSGSRAPGGTSRLPGQPTNS